METEIEPFLSTLKLSQNATRLVEAVIERKVVTTSEISSIVTQCGAKNPRETRDTLQKLWSHFAGQGIILLTGVKDVERRKEKKELAKTQRRTGATSRIMALGDLHNFDVTSIEGRDEEITDAERSVVEKLRVLPREMAHALIDRYQQQGSMEALAMLVSKNQGLVYWMAKRYAYYYSAVDIQDLVQEGNQGLVIGIEKTDTSLGFQFSTYALWWIRQRISRYCQNFAGHIRLPVHIQEKRRQIIKRADPLFAEMKSSQADVDEEDEDWVPTEDERMDADLSELTEEDQRILTDTTFYYSSMDAPIGETDDDMHKVFGDEESTSADFRIRAIEELEVSLDEIGIVLSNLELLGRQSKQKDRAERMIAVLKMRYGLNKSSVRYTFEEIGEKLGVTKARVQQVEIEIWTTLKELGCPINEREFEKEIEKIRLIQDLLGIEDLEFKASEYEH